MACLRSLYARNESASYVKTRGFAIAKTRRETARQRHFTLEVKYTQCLRKKHVSDYTFSAIT